MKRIITSLFLGCALLTSTTIKAQNYSPLSFGVKAGVSLATTNEDDYEMKAGFIGGVVVDYSISKNFFLRSGLDFVMKGAKLDKERNYIDNPNINTARYRIKDDVRLNYLQIPLTIGYKTNLSDDIVGFVNAGPYFGFGVYGKGKSSIRLVAGEVPEGAQSNVEIKSDSFDDLNLKKFDFGVTGSFGIEYSNYFISVGYEYGLTNSAKKVDGKSYSWHNMNGTCTLGYKF